MAEDPQTDPIAAAAPDIDNLARPYSGPARPIVASMIAAAAAEPARAAAFQGAPGANSHVAVCSLLPEWLPLPCFSFEQAVQAVCDGDAGCAVIPIENSLFGRVADVHFLLPESGLSIVSEHFMPIRHAMLGLGSRSQVRQVMSHPQALGQCRHWLKAQGIGPIAYSDTAGAAALVAELGDPAIAALAPVAAAALYGLQVLARDIADNADNTTRFVTLARDQSSVTLKGPWMTTLIFDVQNSPAALYRALGGFATGRVTLTKLESYQRGTSFAATGFYVDFEGRPGEPQVDGALRELAFHADNIRIIGIYRRSPHRPR